MYIPYISFGCLQAENPCIIFPCDIKCHVVCLKAHAVCEASNTFRDSNPFANSAVYNNYSSLSCLCDKFVVSSYHILPVAVDLKVIGIESSYNRHKRFEPV